MRLSGSGRSTASWAPTGQASTRFRRLSCRTRSTSLAGQSSRRTTLGCCASYGRRRRRARGCDDRKRARCELCPAAPEPTDAGQDGLVDYLVYRPRPDRAAYRIFRTDRGFRVGGSLPEREELEEALRAAGAKAGAEVELGDETVTL